MNNNEIWPNFRSISNTLADSQIGDSLQPSQGVTYENQKHHLIRKESNVAPNTSYAYHATLNNNRTAVDNVRVAPEAYDFIDARINLSTSKETFLQSQAQK